MGYVLVRRGRQGGLAIVVDRIHVGAEVQLHLQGLQHFALGPGILMTTSGLRIAGATGGTGQQLVEQALARGHHISAFVRTLKG